MRKHAFMSIFVVGHQRIILTGSCLFMSMVWFYVLVSDDKTLNDAFRVIISHDYHQDLNMCFPRYTTPSKIKLSICFIGYTKYRPSVSPFTNRLADTKAWIWLCTNNSAFLRAVVTNSPRLITVCDLNGCHGNQTKFWTLSYMVATESPTVIAFK